MVSKSFVLSGETFTLQVPLAFQKKHKAKATYAFSVKQKGKVYLVHCGNTYIGVLHPVTGVFLHGYEVNIVHTIFKRLIKAIWEDRNVDVDGWKLFHEWKCENCGYNIIVPREKHRCRVNYGSPVVTDADIVANNDWQEDVWGEEIIPDAKIPRTIRTHF